MIEMIQELEQRRENLDAQIRALEESRVAVIRDLRKAKSQAWFAATGVTRDMIESSSHEDEWFGHTSVFAAWLKKYSNKTYAEWNGRVYHVSDLLAGRLPDMPGCIEDAPVRKKARDERVSLSDACATMHHAGLNEMQKRQEAEAEVARLRAALARIAVGLTWLEPTQARIKMLRADIDAVLANDEDE